MALLRGVKDLTKSVVCFGSSGRTRTYNPSVNSRMACSRLTLQTLALRHAKYGLVPKLGGLWGYSVDRLVIAWGKRPYGSGANDVFWACTVNFSFSQTKNNAPFSTKCFPISVSR
jgi:hypothetical protein